MQTGCKSFRLWNLTAALLVTLGLVGGGGSSGSVVATPTNGRGETRQTSTTSRCWTTRGYEKNCYHADPLDLATSSTGTVRLERQHKMDAISGLFGSSWGPDRTPEVHTDLLAACDALVCSRVGSFATFSALFLLPSKGMMSDFS